MGTIGETRLALGVACEKLHHATVRNVRSNPIKCDEIWSLVSAKPTNGPSCTVGFWDDLRTRTAIDPSQS